MTVLGLTIGPKPSSSSAATATAAAGAADSREAVNDLFRMIDTDGMVRVMARSSYLLTYLLTYLLSQCTMGGTSSRDAIS